MSRPIDVVVAGHICLDIIPELAPHLNSGEALFVPGGLVAIGPSSISLGGAVANTGLALHRLGCAVRLVGRLGDDLFGKAIMASIDRVDGALNDFMSVVPGETTSYSLVLSPPHVDRGFLHCSGANDSFSADDLANIDFRDVRIVHFGYPPLMQAIVADGGHGVAQAFASAQAAGALVSLDMAMPTQQTAPPAVDWRAWLARVLPQVDLFMPSWDELTVLLGQDFDGAAPDPAELSRAASLLLDLGASIVVIKLGAAGLYLRTGQVMQLATRRPWCEFPWKAWENQVLAIPAFDVPVRGTTGAGDCAIAGFLVGLLHGNAPYSALTAAAAAGAWSVQADDGASAIPTWEQLLTVPGAPLESRKD